MLIYVYLFIYCCCCRRRRRRRRHFYYYCVLSYGVSTYLGLKTRKWKKQKLEWLEVRFSIGTSETFTNLNIIKMLENSRQTPESSLVACRDWQESQVRWSWCAMSLDGDQLKHVGVNKVHVLVFLSGNCYFCCRSGRAGPIMELWVAKKSIWAVKISLFLKSIYIMFILCKSIFNRLRCKV